jgi:chromosome segregation ATPase
MPTRQEAGMTPAEANSFEDLGLGEVIGLLGWPWKLALGLMLAAPALLLLEPWSVTHTAALALGSLGGGALLALLVAPWTLRRLLAAPALAPTPATPPAPATEGGDLLPALRRLLEQQQLHVQEATAVVGRAVTAGAQLSSLAHTAERRLSEALERPAPLPVLPPSATPRLEAALDRLDALQEALQGLPGTAAASLQAGAETLDRSAQQLAASALPAGTLSATTERLADTAERIDRAARQLELAASMPPAPAADAAPGQTDLSTNADLLQRLDQTVRSLGGHVDRVVHGEATLGDAARYLTETTDRFAEGTAKLETELVRLQALISIAAQREPGVAPLREALTALEAQIAAASRLGNALDHTQQHMLEALAATAEVAASRPEALSTGSPAAQPPTH